MSATAVNKLSALIFVALVADFSSPGVAQDQIDKEFWLEQKKFAADEFFSELKAPDENTLRLRDVFIFVSALINPTATCYGYNMLVEIDEKIAEIDRITEIAKNNISADPELVPSIHVDRIRSIAQELTNQLKSATNIGDKLAISKKIDELTRSQVAARGWQLRNAPQRQIVLMADKARIALNDVRAKVVRMNASDSCKPIQNLDGPGIRG